MNKLLLSSLTLTVLKASSCTDAVPDHMYRIGLLNNTPERIAFIVSYDYPDTSLPAERPFVDVCPPGSKANIESRDNWDKVFQEKAPGGRLQVFTFNEDSLTANTWATIVQQQSYQKRISISLDELKAAGYTIAIK